MKQPSRPLLNNCAIKRIVALFLCLVFSAQSALAQTPAPGYGADVYTSRISEYFFSRSGKEVLKPIRLLGNVTRPGVYHIPTGLDLTTLLSISGGMDKDAETKNILLARANGENLTVNLFDTIKTGSEIRVYEGDVVFVPKQQVTFDQSTMNAVTVVTSIVTVLLTGYLVLKPNN